MKLITHTQVTLDGVMQGNGGATHEEERNGFTRGGWAMGAFDDKTIEFITETYQNADAFLFGRKTYDIFAGSWGEMKEMRSQPIGTALNTKPKYVVSDSPMDAKWKGTTVLSGDVESAIKKLKARPGGELQVHGSGALIRWLLERNLVDEITLLIVPIILGQGTRLFPDHGPDIALELISSQTDSKGVTIQVYRLKGRPQYHPSLPEHLK